MSASLALIVIMIFSGAAGGLTNFLLNQVPPAPDGSDAAKKLSASGYIFVGVVAAFIVPLFLTLVQSSLVKEIMKATDQDPHYAEQFVFAGFCLVAAVSSRTFLQTVSSRVLNAVKEAKAEAQAAKAETARLKQELGNTRDLAIASEETAENAMQPAVSAEATLAQPSAAEREAARALSLDERTILMVFRKVPLKLRTISGIARDSGFEAPRVEAIVAGVVTDGLLGEFPSKITGNRLFRLTGKGAAALAKQS